MQRNFIFLAEFSRRSLFVKSKTLNEVLKEKLYNIVKSYVIMMLQLHSYVVKVVAELQLQ